MTLDSVLVPALQVVALQTELPIPAWGFGAISLGLLVTMLGIVLSMGKGRPHS